MHLSPGVTVFVGENGEGKTNLVEGVEYLSTFSSHRVNADAALVRQGATAAVVRVRIQGDDSPAFSSGSSSAASAAASSDPESPAASSMPRSPSRSTLIELEILAGKANRGRINRAHVRPKEILGVLPSVVFAPEDLGLVNGNPSTRRKFLDSLMVQMVPRMQAVKEDYEKILKQRAAVLKYAQKMKRRGIHVDEHALDIWDEQLINCGTRIIYERNKIIKELRPYVQQYYEEISASHTSARIDYQASINSAHHWQLPDLLSLMNERLFMNERAQKKENNKENNKEKDTKYDKNNDLGSTSTRTSNSNGAHEYGEYVAHEAIARREEIFEHQENIAALFKQALEENRHKDIDAGVNGIGPHRDDIRLGLGSLPAKGFASHGESWSYALALKLAQWQVLRNVPWREKDRSEPILILDDVFSELDKKRRDRLAAIISPAQQVLVTAAVGDELPEGLHATYYRVHDGQVNVIDKAG